MKHDGYDSLRELADVDDKTVKLAHIMYDFIHGVSGVYIPPLDVLQRGIRKVLQELYAPEGVRLVTRESAIEALEHVEQFNGGGRMSWAITNILKETQSPGGAVERSLALEKTIKHITETNAGLVLEVERLKGHIRQQENDLLRYDRFVDAVEAAITDCQAEPSK